MTFSLFDGPVREPSQFVAFAGGQINRDAENRSADAVEQGLRDPAARILLVRNGRLIFRPEEDGLSSNFSASQASALTPDFAGAILLGQSPSGPLLAVPLGNDPPEDLRAIDYRSVYMQGLLAGPGLSEIALAGALLNWHGTHKFCGRCGGLTEMGAGGFKRQCTQCKAEHFPRTDPVAIMLTVTADKCLLGRSAHFAAGMYSALAGFIEHGETIEEAVRRETLEEAGVRLGRVRYHASQPWPFPYSLMIGCFGEALHEDIDFDGKELQDCRWFGRDEVFAMLDRTHPDGLAVPPQQAIAHHLIRAWAESEG